MKKFLSLTAIVAMLLVTVTGCFGKSDKKTIGLSISTLNNPFFVDLKNGVEEQAEELGFEVIVYDAQDESSKELSNVEDLISKKVDIIIINPTDSDAVGAAVKAANEAKIPVITVDRSASEGDVVTHIASDNVAGGKMAGEYLLELVGENGRVVELEGIPGASATIDRGTGFNEAIKDKLNVVAKQTAEFNREKGLNVMENIIQANEGIVGVFAHNDEMALGALAAIEAAELEGIFVVGFDATDDAVEAVNDGRMAATVAQQPKLMGTMSVDYAKKILNDENVAANIPVSLTLIKAE
ncbi:MAG: ribose ABC transporter substrate-binding protein RbsB [Bacilli bacterium]|nr:ribose ABC transporter substrate-binding protein RbsB [Bacilli bacterium]